MLASSMLEPSEFSTLVFYQTIIFLIQVVFDNGVVQLGLRETALVKIKDSISRHSLPAFIAQQYQGIRLLIHTVLAVFITAIFFVFRQRSSDALLHLFVPLYLLSNVLNVDWILVSYNQKILWAKKFLIFGGCNVLSAFTFLHFFSTPSMILLAQCVSNIVCAIYIYKKQFFPRFCVFIPKQFHLKQAAMLALTGIFTHAAYNIPAIVALSGLHSASPTSFALMYRIFAASTFFVPPIVEFRMVPLLTSLRSCRTLKAYFAIVFTLIGPLVPIVCCIFVIGNFALYDLFKLFFDIDKYIVMPTDLLYAKVALLFYCIEYCALKTLYVIGRNNILLISCVSGFAVAMAGIIMIFQFTDGAMCWFYPIYAYQTVSSIAAVATFKRQNEFTKA